jgi:hypothetical protein
MGKEAAWMEKLLELLESRRPGRPRPGGRVKLANSRGWPILRGVAPPGGVRSYVVRGGYAFFFSTRAEFFDPNPTQLQMAYSIWALRPMSGT